MLHNIPENASLVASLHSTYQIDYQISDHQAEALPLTSQINAVTNSSESLASIATHFYPAEENVGSSHSQMGWLKYLLLGVTIFTGAAGTFSYYSRKDNGAHTADVPHAELLSQPEMPSLALTERLYTPDVYNQIPYMARVTFNSTNPDNPHEPYLYYKKIYSLKEWPDSIKKGDFVYIGSVLSRRHDENHNPAEISRADFLNTIPKDLYYPLGKEMYYHMSEFYKNEIDNIISSAFNGSEEEKRTAVKRLLETFNKYQSLEATVKNKNSDREKLLPIEHIEEKMIHRKYHSLLTAMDVIMNNKSKFHYMSERIKDDTEYSEEQVLKMKEDIGAYISATN